VEKLLPVTNYDDYYVNLMDKSIVTTVTEDGLPPSVYNQKATTAKSVA
jgi:hypothetical protein